MSYTKVIKTVNEAFYSPEATQHTLRYFLPPEISVSPVGLKVISIFFMTLLRYMKNFNPLKK